jgi:hypothetical protein
MPVFKDTRKLRFSTMFARAGPFASLLKQVKAVIAQKLPSLALTEGHDANLKRVASVLARPVLPSPAAAAAAWRVPLVVQDGESAEPPL